MKSTTPLNYIYEILNNGHVILGVVSFYLLSKLTKHRKHNRMTLSTFCHLQSSLYYKDISSPSRHGAGVLKPLFLRLNDRETE